MLLVAGTWSTTVSELRNTVRDIVPSERIARNCTQITKLAPTMAAMIWATSRVRLAPIVANKRIVTTAETATATIASAAMTPYAASHRGPARQAITSITGAANTSDIPMTDAVIAPIRTANSRLAAAGDDRTRSRSPRA